MLEKEYLDLGPARLAYWQAELLAVLYANRQFPDYEIINQLNDKCQLALDVYTDAVNRQRSISDNDIEMMGYTF